MSRLGQLAPRVLRFSGFGFSLVAAACGSSHGRGPTPLCEAPCAVVGTGFGSIKELAADETGVYLVDVRDGVETLRSIQSAGARPIDLATPEAEVALRVRGGRAYWVEWVSDVDAVAKVQSVAGAGSEVTTHFKLDDGIVSLEVDEQHAYAQVPGVKPMYRIPLDGSSVSTYPSDDVLMGLGLDEDRLFLLDLGPDGSACQIRSMPIAGGESTLLYEGQQSSEGRCEAMHFSAKLGHLFWMDMSLGPTSGTLKTIPEAGGTALSLLTDVTSWSGNFASDEQNVYFGGELGDGRAGLIQAPIAGGDAEVLYAAAVSLVAADRDRVYFALDQGEERGAVLSLPR